MNFYHMIPLTFEEMQFKIYHSAQELLERFAPEQLAVVDIHRESVCGDLPKKRFAIPRHLLKGEGDHVVEIHLVPAGELAAHRVLVEALGLGEHQAAQLGIPYIMKPTPERNYYVLSTFGMGAHRMNVPEELADQKLERATTMRSVAIHPWGPSPS